MDTRIRGSQTKHVWDSSNLSSSIVVGLAGLYGYVIYIAFFGTTSRVICLFPLPDPGTLEHDSWFQLPDCGVCPYAGGFP